MKTAIKIVAVVLAVAIITWFAVEVGPADSGPRPSITHGGSR